MRVQGLDDLLVGRFGGTPWAADNDCFNGLDSQRYLAMLATLSGLPDLGDCRFVTVPDVVRCSACCRTVDGYGGGGACCCGASPRFVVGDAALTLARFEEWVGILEQLCLPVGFVLQDGAEDVGVPWERIDALFIGGSTEFKLGAAARAFAQIAVERAKHVHWGRVNTRNRVQYIADTHAADSFDGSSFARWRKTLLDKGLQWARATGTLAEPERLAA